MLLISVWSPILLIAREVTMFVRTLLCLAATLAPLAELPSSGCGTWGTFPSDSRPRFAEAPCQPRLVCPSAGVRRGACPNCRSEASASSRQCRCGAMCRCHPGRSVPQVPPAGREGASGKHLFISPAVTVAIVFGRETDCHLWARSAGQRLPLTAIQRCSTLCRFVV